MSIFTRDCPVCAATHPVNVVRCGCGYCFDPNKIDGVTQELEVISQEEQLYRDYLAARAAQAEEAARTAKTLAASDPANTVKNAEALLAAQTAMNARAELEAQDARAAAVKNRIKVVRSSRRRKGKSSASAAPKPAPRSVRETLAPSAAPAPVQATAKPPAVAKPVIELAPPAPAAKSTPPPSQPRPAPVARPASAPTPAFRETQAAKAEQIAPLPPPKKSTGPECPNCYAKVPANAKRCRCGYELPSSGSQIPGLAMSPEDRAAMLAALGLNRDTGS